MLGLAKHDSMYVYVDKNDGMKRIFFMSLGHDGDYPAASDHWCIYGWIIPWVPQALRRDSPAGGIWTIDLKSHWVRALEMSRIGPMELMG